MEEKLTSTQLTLMGSGELAYLGDSVYEMQIRKSLILRGTRKSGNLSKEARNYVSAPSQANILQLITEELSEDELKIVMRGRNSKLKYTPKNATQKEYAYATGLECLFGYLSLSGDDKRLEELTEMIFRKVGEQRAIRLYTAGSARKSFPTWRGRNISHPF
jgi:ribonuclease-3 family protein